MSYPPTPDPFSVPSSRRVPSSQQGGQFGSHSSQQVLSSADQYGRSGYDNAAPDNLRYDRVNENNHHSTVPLSHSRDDSQDVTSRMLGTGSYSHHPLNDAQQLGHHSRSSSGMLLETDSPRLNSFTNLSDDEFYRSSHYSNAPSHLRDSLHSYNDGPGGHVHSGGRDLSSMNLSIAHSDQDDYRDSDSQRGLYDAPGSAGSRGRRGSNLAYSQYDNVNPNGSTEELDNEKDYSQRDRRAMGGAGMLAGAGGIVNDKSRLNSSTLRKTRNANNINAASGGSRWSRLSSKARCWLIIGLLLLIAAIAVIAGVLASILPKKSAASTSAASDSNAAASNNNNGGGILTRTSNTVTTTKSAPTGVATGSSSGINWRTAAVGGDGSTIYAANNDVFIYNNTFGGFWNAIPFNDSAQAQSDVPPLNVPWDYNFNRINGVNLGGWLVIEPFISPALFEPFSSGDGGYGTVNTAVDEWTLCVALGSKMAATIENHYATFITERDFAEIAGAGLNWVRIPVPYWLIEVYPGEPFLANVGWKYFLQGLTWARKYGLRVNLDFHAVPGSQNGFNHSSKLGTVNFLNGIMGIANAQRTLNYVRTLTEFITQPEYLNVIPMFGILNEPLAATIGIDSLRHYYLEVYNTIRAVTNVGTGMGPMISFHDGFAPIATTVGNGGWLGFLAGADRISLDTHPYLCFAAPNADSLAYQSAKPCVYWGEFVNVTRQQFGVYIAGEWSLAINDCGKWVNNVGNGARYDGTYRLPGTTNPQYAGVGECTSWNDWTSYNASIKAGLNLVAEGNMDALSDWFFWTWKTGVSTVTGKVTTPLWNYQLALEQGYMPVNPRVAVGACENLVAANSVTMSIDPFNAYSEWQTGGAATASPIAASLSAPWSAWPPSRVGGTPTAFLPVYTATEPIITMSGSKASSYPAGYSSNPSLGQGNGWVGASDTALFNTPISGCIYPNAWSGAGAAIPRTSCAFATGVIVGAAVLAVETGAVNAAALVRVTGSESILASGPVPTAAP